MPRKEEGERSRERKKEIWTRGRESEWKRRSGIWVPRNLIHSKETLSGRLLSAILLLLLPPLPSPIAPPTPPSPTPSFLLFPERLAFSSKTFHFIRFSRLFSRAVFGFLRIFISSNKTKWTREKCVLFLTNGNAVPLPWSLQIISRVYASSRISGFFQYAYSLICFCNQVDDFPLGSRTLPPSMVVGELLPILLIYLFFSAPNSEFWLFHVLYFFFHYLFSS